MNKRKILAAALSAVCLAGCTGDNEEPPEESRSDYVAVYQEILPPEETAQNAQNEEITETQQTQQTIAPNFEGTDMEYLDQVLIVGDERCGAFSEYGLLPKERVISIDGADAASILDSSYGDTTVGEYLKNDPQPYIYLSLSFDKAPDRSAEQFGREILDVSTQIRELCPDSMVLILGNSPLSAANPMADMTEEYNEETYYAIKSSPDEYLIYMETAFMTADSSGYLKAEYDSGDGRYLSPAGAQALLELIARDRFFNDMHTDMSVFYDKLYAERAPYTVTEGKVAYLTFDDGPSKYTPQVLEILREHNIKATFFITGWTIAGKEEILKQVSDEGHTVALHSWLHDYEAIYESTDAWMKDFLKVYSKVYGVTGQKPWAFRFPGGSYNNHNRDTADDIIAEMQRRGFAYYDWNAATMDATTEATYDSCMDYFKESINADHEVVLMHDSLEITPEYLPDLIAHLISEGYSFETIDTADEIHF